MLSSTVVFIPQETIKKRWRKKEKRKLKGGENILISAGWDGREKYRGERCKRKERKKKRRGARRWWMPGYDSSPAPSLHLNCTGTLTILPEIPHSSGLNNTTQSPLNHCIACLFTAEQTHACTTSWSDFTQVCMNMFDPGFQRRIAASHGASHMKRSRGTLLWTLAYVWKSTIQVQGNRTDTTAGPYKHKDTSHHCLLCLCSLINWTTPALNLHCLSKRQVPWLRGRLLELTHLSSLWSDGNSSFHRCPSFTS